MGQTSSGSQEFDTQLRHMIGASVRRVRNELELTQEEAAEQLGITSEFYARIERGHALPSVPTFYLIVTTLQVSAAELLGLANNGNSASKSHHLLLQPPGPDAPELKRPELKRIMKRLQDASPDKVRLVTMLVKELEERFGEGKNRSGN